MILEKKLIFGPQKFPGGRYREIQELIDRGNAGMQIQDRWLTTGDGVKLHGWLCSPTNTSVQSGSRKLLLWFHGNAGNITTWFNEVRLATTLPADVLIIDYRGYGRSQGKPDEAGLYLDAAAAWDLALTEVQGARNRVIIYGFSLGGGVGIELATRVDPAGLIVQSSFTSIPDVARSLVPFVPATWISTKMASLDKVSTLTCPKLFIHSPGDELIPYRQGRRLFAAAASPKTFHMVPRQGHNETFIGGGTELMQVLHRFLYFGC